jgi:hypothetical protein
MSDSLRRSDRQESAFPPRLLVRCFSAPSVFNPVSEGSQPSIPGNTHTAGCHAGSRDNPRHRPPRRTQDDTTLAFGKQIAYTENEPGEYDILDVIRRLTVFCKELFPGKSGKHPVIAYASKSKCLELFLTNKKQFLALRPILVDCFRLHDQIEVMMPLV